MALNNGYESKINKLVPIAEIKNQIQLAIVGSPKFKHNEEVIFITEDDKVNAFTYPIYDSEKDRVYIDTRTFTTIGRDGNLKITNAEDMSTYLALANMELVWHRNKRRDNISNSLEFSNKNYVLWLTNLIARRTGAAPYQKTKILSLTAMYLVGQYFNDVTSETAAQPHIKYIVSNFPVDFETLDGVATDIEYLFPRDLDEYCECIKKLGLGPRFASINAGTILQLLGGSWYATSNANYLIATALEYPPAFSVLVFKATGSKLYKNTEVGRQVDTYNRNNAYEAYRRSFTRLIDNFTDSRG